MSSCIFALFVLVSGCICSCFNVWLSSCFFVKCLVMFVFFLFQCLVAFLFVFVLVFVFVFVLVSDCVCILLILMSGCVCVLFIGPESHPGLPLSLTDSLRGV